MKKILATLIIPAFLFSSSAFALGSTANTNNTTTQTKTAVNEKVLKTELLKLGKTGVVIKKDIKKDLTNTKTQNIKNKQKKNIIAKQQKVKATKKTSNVKASTNTKQQKVKATKKTSNVKASTNKSVNKKITPVIKK